MRPLFSWGWLVMLAAASLVLFSDGAYQAQEKKDLGDLHESLREVINVGAKLFNEQGDHNGCFRLYQGALLATKPFLPPEVQKKIDETVLKANGLAIPAERAFALRKALDELRDQIRPGGPEKKGVEKKVEEKKQPEKKVEEKKQPEKKVEEKKVEEKKVEEKKQPEKKVEEKKVEEKKLPEKKVEEKKIEDKKVEEKKLPEKKVEEKKVEDKTAAADQGQLSGKVTIDGKSLPGGFFVTLVPEKGSKQSTLVSKDGDYQFTKAIAPGTYRVAIEPAPDNAPAALKLLPERYRSADTSGITVEVRAGKQKADLNLAK